MGFGVGDGWYGSGCDGSVTCHGARGESCHVFPCPPYDGIYAAWWTSGCGRTPSATFYLHYWTGTRWEILGQHTPDVYEGYVWVRWAFNEGNCGWAYKVTFLNDEVKFLVGDVPPDKIPCEMWTKEMISFEKTRLKRLIADEKADASADVKAYRADASLEVKSIRGKAKVDIVAERAEYKEISTSIRAQVKRDLTDNRSDHDEYEARIKAEYKAAKTLSDDTERDEKADIRGAGKIDIAEEKRKETDDIGNIRKQRDLDVAAEYKGRDLDISNRYVNRDNKIREIIETGKPCVII